MEEIMELEVRTGNGKLLFKWNPDTSTLSIVLKGFQYRVKLGDFGFILIEEKTVKK
jgi:hypothetical protein